jgi:hypothetical protein
MQHCYQKQNVQWLQHYFPLIFIQFLMCLRSHILSWIQTKTSCYIILDLCVILGFFDSIKVRCLSLFAIFVLYVCNGRSMDCIFVLQKNCVAFTIFASSLNDLLRSLVKFNFNYKRLKSAASDLIKFCNLRTRANSKTKSCSFYFRQHRELSAMEFSVYLLLARHKSLASVPRPLLSSHLCVWLFCFLGS